VRQVAAENVTPAHRLPPISAGLAAYNRVIAHNEGNGVSTMKTTTANSAKKARKVRESEHTALDRRYGQIGISAVAAAARYQGEAKNPAYAPVAPGRFDDDTVFG